MNHFQVYKSNVENAQGVLHSDLEFASLLMANEAGEELPELQTTQEFLEEIRNFRPYLILVSPRHYSWIRRLGRNILDLTPSTPEPDSERKRGEPYVQLRNRFYEGDGYGDAEVYIAYFGAETESQNTFCTFVNSDGVIKHYDFHCAY